MSSRNSGPGFGTALVAALLLGLISFLFSILFIWLGWNVLNIHDVYGISTDATFEQLAVSALIVGFISSGSRSGS